MANEIRFRLNGKNHSLSRQHVEASVEGYDPGVIDKYSVRIGRKRLPIKQVLSLALNVPPAAFTSQQAYALLTRLGFEVAIESQDKRRVGSTES